MQLDDLESFISKLYKLNLTQLVRLSKIREEEGGLTYGANVAEYNVRIRDDDRYRKIKTEINIINEGEFPHAQQARESLYYLLSERLDELSEESVERIRFRGAGRRKVQTPLHLSRISRLEGKVETLIQSSKREADDDDKDFLESCQIKGDVSWIKN